MPNKSKKSEEPAQQLSLFETNDDINATELNDSGDDWMSGDDSDFEITSDRKVETQASELLTLKLLQRAIATENPDDLIMQDFSQYVLPKLLQVAIGVTAKGGKFFDYLDKKKGKENVRRDNASDQSLNTHLLNGLLPANLIERRLKKLDTTARRVIREKERRLLIAGFILHDFEKFDYRFFPTMPEVYRAISLDKEQKIRELPLAAHRDIIDVIVRELNLDKFISPDEPEAWQQYRDDLLFIAYNAQRRSDTNLNLSEHGLQPILNDYVLVCLADLTCIADLLASVIKHPQDAEHRTLNGILHSLSDGQLKLSYHRVSENRGVLTNVVNNALMEAHTSLNTGEYEYYKPLLYLPTGVVYLTLCNSPLISTEDLPNRVVNKIKEFCGGQLIKRQTGFGRDGKGMKYAEYYDKFFDDIGLMRVALKATLRILKTGKNSVAKSRSDNLVKFQQQGVLSADYNFKFSDDIRIDQIAEFGDVITRKIWGEKVNKIEESRKEGKKSKKELPPFPDLDLVGEVAKLWNLEKSLPQIREIQSINDKLKELKLKGNTGGVPYEWYYLAAKYLERHPGIENVEEVCEGVINHLAKLISPIVAQYQLPDGWDDLRLWVQHVVILPGKDKHQDVDSTKVFLDELERYQLAKKSGRGRQLICSVSHSAYTVTEQMESAVLFTPQVYTNKQMLGGSNAKRNISSIAGIEMMLRQILMNQTQAVGKRFEDGKYRYLYFYPTYYCTPETNKFLQWAYTNIAQTRFNASIRNHFINDDLQADFGRQRYQSVDTFLIDEDLQRKKDLPDNHPEHKQDRTFKLSYPEDQPLTFYFIALPPGLDPTDTESWVMPSWLAFAFPMILDVKTVVSESPIPPFNDGAEFEETVFLDSAPAAFRVLVGRDKFRLDYILEGWEENNKQYSAPLNVLTAAYAIHLDVNAKQNKGKYDSNWGKFSELARDLETSPLNVFSYLKSWTRRQGVETPSINKIKLYAYYFYPCFDPHAKYDFQLEKWTVTQASSLNHPRELTERFRKFYRHAKKTGRQPIPANAILKPIDVAADVILKADTSFSDDALIDLVTAEVFQLMKRVHASRAEGRWMISKKEEELHAIRDFAEYFVVKVFNESFVGDRARLQGRQMNYIRNTCEYLYRLSNYEERPAKGEDVTDDLDEDVDDSDANE
ncbi:type I-D CRISPR-associated protein Cas10d/Csc3 [Scytonema hofmannii PCC 7110]|uniref:Type I-D CRISPR-associated protein Cas10d/Csc3 n=1 Tax=Scytonema hofmannii PCC 7110 TaxID=128403 RepID=A0A139X3W9_9CYAN|nr:type I-D CRISPR-associated protein Cas10d/Csc3 [Scytonema hofmannii]KYC39370.1 type I-D CRISPR-associated protein Cas10d/Csc3 [Scytonema hofmannii PCC 7110]